MKPSLMTAAFACLLPLSAIASDQGIRFDTDILENGQSIATPSVWVEFNEEAIIEVSGSVRIVASAGTPTGNGRSHVKARMYYFENGKWVLDWEPEMDAAISQTPSFERTMGDKIHRVVLKPRIASQPNSEMTSENK